MKRRNIVLRYGLAFSLMLMAACGETTGNGEETEGADDNPVATDNKQNTAKSPIPSTKQSLTSKRPKQSNLNKNMNNQQMMTMTPIKTVKFKCPSYKGTDPKCRGRCMPDAANNSKCKDADIKAPCKGLAQNPCLSQKTCTWDDRPAPRAGEKYKSICVNMPATPPPPPLPKYVCRPRAINVLETYCHQFDAHVNRCNGVAGAANAIISGQRVCVHNGSTVVAESCVLNGATTNAICQSLGGTTSPAGVYSPNACIRLQGLLHNASSVGHAHHIPYNQMQQICTANGAAND
ncbi:MAG: hypothetical protein AAF320_05975, partial [Myxococcota bacterium]